MKRIVGIVVVLLLLASCAFAEGTTEKKNAFEFCDMYMQRLWEMKYERGLDATHDLAHYIGYDAFRMRICSQATANITSKCLRERSLFPFLISV